VAKGVHVGGLVHCTNLVIRLWYVNGLHLRHINDLVHCTNLVIRLWYIHGLHLKHINVFFQVSNTCVNSIFDF